MEQWLKPAQGAKYCSVSLKTFRSWLQDGLKHSRLKSGHILIKISNIDEYLQRFEITESAVDRFISDILEGF